MWLTVSSLSPHNLHFIIIIIYINNNSNKRSNEDKKEKTESKRTVKYDKTKT